MKPHGPSVTRRAFTARLGWQALGVLGIASGARRATASGATDAQPALAALPEALLERSPFVYISPLRSDGAESTCHAELWYAWLDDSVVVTVASDRWKASALTQGLDRARVWVGDHGRWKTMLGGRNEAFRKAPSFEAQAERIEDTGTLDRLLSAYEKKYPDEIDQWRDRMRQGYADGSRVLIRYRPTSDSVTDS